MSYIGYFTFLRKLPTAVHTGTKPLFKRGAKEGGMIAFLAFAHTNTKYFKSFLYISK